MTIDQEMTIDGQALDAPVIHIDDPAPAVTAVQQRAIEHLTEQLAAAEARHAATLKDLAIVADHLKQEAINRDWCDDYRYFVDLVNGQCSSPRLEHVRYTYSARFSVEVRFTSHLRNYDTLVDRLTSYVEELAIEDADVTDISVSSPSVERVDVD